MFDNYQLFIGQQQTEFANEDNRTHETIAQTIYDMVTSLQNYVHSPDYQGPFQTLQYPTTITSFYNDIYNTILEWTWTDGTLDEQLLNIIICSKDITLRYSDHYLAYVIDFDIHDQYITEEEDYDNS